MGCNSKRTLHQSGIEYLKILHPTRATKDPPNFGDDRGNHHHSTYIIEPVRCNTTTMMSLTRGESNNAMRKKDRAGELRRARKMIDNLQARRATSDHHDDLSEFTEILSTVVDVLQSLEMQENSADDSGTAATLPETVATSDTDELTSSCHGVTATRAVDDSYDDDQIHYEEPRRVRKHKRRQSQQRQESFSDDILDETDFSQGLSGYEEGFYPPEDEDLDVTSISASFAGPTVSVLGFDTPTTRRSKATASISEESQCFYCAMHGNGEGCQGTRFCC